MVWKISVSVRSTIVSYQFVATEVFIGLEEGNFFDILTFHRGKYFFTNIQCIIRGMWDIDYHKEISPTVKI